MAHCLCCVRFLVALALLTSFGRVGFSADPEAKPAAEIDEAAYAPRKLKFAESNLVYSMPLGILDEKASQEQWYVAVIELKGANPPGADTFQAITLIAQMIEATPEKVRPPEALLNTLLERKEFPVNKATGGTPYPRTTRVRAGGSERSLGQRTYTELEGGTVSVSRLGREISASTSRNKDQPRSFVGRRTLKTRGFVRGPIRLEVLAHTASEATQLAEALLVVYDQGLALPGRKTSAKLMVEAQARLEKNTAALEAANAQLAEATKKAEAAEGTGVGREVFAELNKKKVFLSVEQIGVLTRIEAIEKKIMAFEKRAAGSAPPNLISLKDAAEIDLAGLKGQMNEIERLTRLERERQEAGQRRRALESTVETATSEGALDKFELEIYELDFLATAPFELRDEAIPVQPVAWTK